MKDVLEKIFFVLQVGEIKIFLLKDAFHNIIFIIFFGRFLIL